MLAFMWPLGTGMVEPGPALASNRSVRPDERDAPSMDMRMAEAGAAPEVRLGVSSWGVCETAGALVPPGVSKSSTADACVCVGG